MRATVAAVPAIEEAVVALATELRDAASAFAEQLLARSFLDAAFDGNATGAIGDRPPKNLATIAASATEVVAPAQTSSGRAEAPRVRRSQHSRRDRRTVAGSNRRAMK